MSTVKHYSFCSGPMRGKSVTDLPGIGDTYGSRLRSQGYCLASDIYEKFKSYNFNSSKCQSWLNSVCDANSRYSGMCYQALKEWHDQFGETRTTPEKCYSPMSDTYLTPLQTLRPINDSRDRMQLSYQLSPTTTTHTPSKSRDSDISRAEVLKMMAEFQKKLDAMAARINVMEEDKLRSAFKINNLEQEKTKLNNKVVSLEARIRQMDNMTTTLQKQLNTRIEQYKSICSSTYLISEKLDELLTQQNKSKQESETQINLEATMKNAEEKVTKLQKQMDVKIAALTKKVNQMKVRSELNTEVISSIDILCQKFDAITKTETKTKQDKPELLEARIEQIEKSVRDLTIEINRLSQKDSKNKKEQLIRAEDVFTSKKSSETIVEDDLSKLALKDEIFEQIKESHLKHSKPNMSSSEALQPVIDGTVAADSVC